MLLQALVMLHMLMLRYALNVVSINSKPLEGCEDDVDAKEQDEGTWKYLIYLNYERSKWLWVKYYASDFFCCCLLFLYPFTIFMLLFWIQHIAHCLLYHSFCCNFYSSKLNLRKPNDCQENINFPSPKQPIGFNA